MLPDKKGVFTFWCVCVCVCVCLCLCVCVHVCPCVCPCVYVFNYNIIKVYFTVIEARTRGHFDSEMFS